MISSQCPSRRICVGGDVFDRDAAPADHAEEVLRLAVKQRLATAGEANRPCAGLLHLGDQLLDAHQRQLVIAAQRGRRTEEAVDVAAIGRIDLDVIRTAVRDAVADSAKDRRLVVSGEVLPAEVGHSFVSERFDRIQLGRARRGIDSRNQTHGNRDRHRPPGKTAGGDQSDRRQARAWSLHDGLDDSNRLPLLEIRNDCL